MVNIGESGDQYGGHKSLTLDILCIWKDKDGLTYADVIIGVNDTEGEIWGPTLVSKHSEFYGREYFQWDPTDEERLECEEFFERYVSTFSSNHNCRARCSLADGSIVELAIYADDAGFVSEVEIEIEHLTI
jgi:hypothetical protein